ncbi:MAG: chaperone NapD [Betaproteobacteria bacterium]|nr:chaperone NapD [Betaproteobacteria bacterium]
MGHEPFGHSGHRGERPLRRDRRGAAGAAGVEVHHTDAATSRVVVVQEAPTIEDEVDGLRRIQALPGVVAAEMVYHYFADDPSLAGTPL